MFVPAFVVPGLIILLALIVCMGIFFICVWVVREHRIEAGHSAPSSPRLNPVLVIVLSWPALLVGLCSFGTLGIVACRTGFYSNVPAPLASSIFLTTTSFNSGTPPGTLNGLVTVNARDGSVRWTREIASANNASAPLSESDGIVYIGTNQNHFEAYRASDGVLLWNTALVPPPGAQSERPFLGFDQPPVVADGLVYVPRYGYEGGGSEPSSVQSNRMYALRTGDGSVAWSLPFQNKGSPSDNQRLIFTAGAGLLVVYTNDGKIPAWHASDGSPAWQISGSTFMTDDVYSFTSGLFFADQTIYFVGANLPEYTAPPDNYAVVVALRASDGQIVWQRELLKQSRPIDGPFDAARFGDHLYLDVGGFLFALNASNGAQLWQWNGGVVGHPAAIEADGVVYVPGNVSTSATLYALRAQDGGQLWSRTLDSSSAFDMLAVRQQVIFATTSSYGAWAGFLQVCSGFSEPRSAIFALNASDGSIYWRNWNVAAAGPLGVSDTA